MRELQDVASHAKLENLCWSLFPGCEALDVLRAALVMLGAGLARSLKASWAGES